MIGDEYDPVVRLVDVRAMAIAAFGPEGAAHLESTLGHVPVTHDWRFEIDTPTGGTVTFARYSNAAQVAAYIEQLKTERAGRA